MKLAPRFSVIISAQMVDVHTCLFHQIRAHGSQQSFHVVVRGFHYSIALMAPLRTVLNDRSSRSSPFWMLLIALDHDLLMSPEVQISDDRAIAPTDWNGFSCIARIVSTSSSDSVFAKLKSIATMGMSGGGPSSLRWTQSRQPFHAV